MTEHIGWYLLDVMWQIAIFGAIVLLLLLMTTWLVVGPWRLIGRIR